MTALEGVNRRAGTGVFIPPCVLQQTACSRDSSLQQPQPCSAVVTTEKHMSLRRSAECSAPRAQSNSTGSQYGLGRSHLSCPVPDEDMSGCKVYQQPNIHSDAAASGTTAARASAAPARRSSGRFSTESTTTTYRSTDSASPGPCGSIPGNSAGSAYSKSRAAPASCSPFQSALYSPSVSASTAMRSAPRAAANQGGRAAARRRMSVDLHALRGAGPAVGGLSSPQMGPGGIMLSPLGYRAAPYQPDLGRRSFDVSSGSVGCYNTNQTGPLLTAAASSGMTSAMASTMHPATRAHSCSSALLCDPLQVQQPESLLGNTDVSRLLDSPALTVEQSLDDQIQTVLMDILDLGNQLAAAADAAGANAAPCSISRQSLDLQPHLASGYHADLSAMPVDMAALAAAPPQQQAFGSVRGLPCNLAPSSADPIVSPRSSFDLLLLQQQQQQQQMLSHSAEAAGIAPLVSLLERTSPLNSSFTGINLDSIDEDPEDLTAYFAVSHQQKMKQPQYPIAAAAVASGSTTPMLSTSPQTTLMSSILPSSGLGGQMLTGLGGLPTNLRPEAQVKLQELMAAQQLQLEIQNELLAMLTA